MRDKNRIIAEETLEIINRGYFIIKGQKYLFKNQLTESKKHTKLFKENQITKTDGSNFHSCTTINIQNETTLSAAKRLKETYDNVFVLNFASAKNPGGGFLKGSIAQEESIARSSTLYELLKNQDDFYSYHKKMVGGLYSSRLVYTKNVIVFRDDYGNLIQPYTINVATTAAVNAGVVVNCRIKKDIEQIEIEMCERIKNVLRLAKKTKQDALVLGAFGCGVFKNDPKMVCQIFIDCLKSVEFQGVFNHITFAIYSPEKNNTTRQLFHDMMYSQLKDISEFTVKV